MRGQSVDKQVARDLEKLELWERIARQASDVESLDALWSDELVVSTTNLLLTKKLILKRIRDGSLRFSRFERRLSKIAGCGNSAVSSGSETIVIEKGPEAGKILHCSYTNCWTHENGRWRLLARQVCIVDRQTIG